MPRSASEIGSGTAVHFGTFQLTDEAIDAPLVALAEAKQAVGVDAFETLGFGETGVYALGGHG